MLTTKEAAALVGIGQQAILKAIQRNVLAAVKFGSGERAPWMIEAQEAERYKHERRPPGRPKGSKNVSA